MGGNGLMSGIVVRGLGGRYGMYSMTGDFDRENYSLRKRR